MTDTWIALLGAIKPLAAACALPPVPFLLLALLGAHRARAGRRSGTAIVALACAGIWLASCNGVADRIGPWLLDIPPALAPGDRAALAARAAAGEPIAIVVLGGGLDRAAPEYGRAVLGHPALERLRYGAWLSRQTGIPLAVSGGVDWAGTDGGATRPPIEADVMGDIAAEDFQRAPRWRERDSRDTRENAVNTVALLAPQGVREIVVVTQGWHMPRALREFRAAARARAAPGAAPIAIRAAPMGGAGPADRAVLDWMPSGTGALRVRAVLREVLAAPFAH
jgi:uncharacterized SAM-binding protein YcdF (DUF218 family)